MNKMMKISIVLSMISLLFFAATLKVSATVETGWPAGQANIPQNPTDGFIDFEEGTEEAVISSTIPGVDFTTTYGIDWRYGDIRTGKYSVYPYGTKAYETNGNFFAWLGVTGDTGRIDFTEGTATYLSVLVSTYSGLTLDAYDADGNFLATSGWASSNINTRTFTRLTVEAPGMAYVLIHDTGNYWLIDDLCTDAPGVSPGGNQPPTVEIVYPLEGETLLEGTVEIMIHAYDDSTSWEELIVEVNIDNDEWTDATPEDWEDYFHYFWDTTTVNDGAHTIYARVHDGEYYSEIDSVTVTIDNNQPPNPPTNPQPGNDETGVSLNPTLSVDVLDPDGDPMDVTFYDAIDGSIIGIDYGVSNGGTATTTWSGLYYENTYFWLAVADDGIGSTISNKWSFTTKPNQQPVVEITSPQEGDTVKETITITGIADDYDGEVIFVEIRTCTNDWEVASGTTSWSYEWDTTNIPPSEQLIEARSYDGIDYSDIVSVKVNVANPEKKALVMGCWDYPGDSDDLPGVQNDVRNIETLLSKGFDFSDDNLRVLNNPGRATLLNEIDDFKQNTNQQDIKFIYFSGHGDQDQVEYIDTSDGYHVYDYELESKFTEEENLSGIFDSCNSGGLCHETDETNDPSHPIRGIDGNSKIIGMAAKSTEDAWESKVFRYGYYTHYICKAFTHSRDKVRKLIPGDDTRVSMEEALSYAKYWTEKVTYLKSKIPFSNVQPQHPQTFDAYSTKNDNNEQYYLSDDPIDDYWSFRGLCPIHIHAYNYTGYHVGLTDYGDIEREIPDVLYTGPGDDEILVIFNPEINDYIQIVAKAYDEGYFTLECQNYDKENQTTTTILYDNIPIINGSIASVIVDNGVFGDMEIDDNGDNITDRIVAPDVLPTTSFVPTANYVYEPLEPFIGEDVTFNASSSYDFDGDIVEFYWAFGDGNSGSGETIEYSFIKAGKHKVNLTVTDDDGLSDIIQKTVEVIMPAVIDIDPDTLNLNSTGKWITCYIEFPVGYNVSDINISTILLNDTVTAELYPTNISDYDNDSIPDLMVKFGRQEVQAILEPGDNVEIMVSGKLLDETLFEGTDYIRVI